MTASERILRQGKALVRAIESLETIDRPGPIEEVITWLLLKAYRRRLRAIVASAPMWVSDEILRPAQTIGHDRPAVWPGEN